MNLRELEVTAMLQGWIWVVWHGAFTNAPIYGLRKITSVAGHSAPQIYESTPYCAVTGIRETDKGNYPESPTRPPKGSRRALLRVWEKRYEP